MKLAQQNLKYINKKETISIISGEGKEKSISVVGVEEVLLYKLETLLWGDSNIHYNRITQEDREKAFQKIISEPHRNSQICKRFEIYKSVENMVSVIYDGVYFYLDVKEDIVSLIRMLKWVCKNVKGKRELEQTFKFEI